MITFDEALAKLLAEVRSLTNVESISLEQVQGRVLAADVISRANVPPHDNSAMDGFAFRIDDLAETNTLPVSQKIFAGMAPQPIQAGTAVRLFTGSVIPDGADSVMMQENCDYSDAQVTINEAATLGQHIRRCGEDITEGSVILTKGTLLEAKHIGLLASTGIKQLEVVKRLRVGLLATGDELIEPGEPLESGQIYDSNRYMIKAELEVLGFQVDARHAVDDLEVIKSTLADLADQNDVVVSIGGVSVGEADFVKTAIEALGELSLWKVAMKPGKPLSYGQIVGKPMFGLPGNPVSAFAAFKLFAKPYLKAMQGLPVVDVNYVKYPLQVQKDQNPKREEFLRVRLESNGAEKYLAVFEHQGSGVLSSVAWASGFARIPMQQTTSNGDLVAYIPFNDE